MLAAVIGIGSNSVRALVARNNEGVFERLYRDREGTRLFAGLDSRGMQAMLNLLMMILTGNILPLTLFPDSWQKVITMLPYAQMLDAPIRLYTGAYAPETAWAILLRQAAWTAVLAAAGCYTGNRWRC